MPLDPELDIAMTTQYYNGGEGLIRYIAPERFVVDGIVYHRPQWYPGGMVRVYDDDELRFQQSYESGDLETDELIIIEPGDEYDTHPDHLVTNQKSMANAA